MTSSKSSRKRSQASIVLAENDRLISEAIGELLRSKGYCVRVATDGLEALQLIKDVRPSFVILDIMMPKLDGSRVCWMVRQDPVLRDTPIIAFSSLSARDFRFFPNLSADAYVAKGPIAEAFRNIMQAIEYIQSGDQSEDTGGLFGYDHIKPREIVGEMLREIRRLNSVLQALGGGTLELDTKGRIVRASVGACEILGRNESQLVGEMLVSLCEERDQPTLRHLVDELAQATRSERCRTVVRWRDLEIPVQLCSVIERGVCTGVFLLMESGGPPDKAQA
jgi:CheY-like chemotaxis protein